MNEIGVLHTLVFTLAILGWFLFWGLADTSISHRDGLSGFQRGGTPMVGIGDLVSVASGCSTSLTMRAITVSRR